MPIENYKSIIYNRKSKTTDDNSVIYEKVYLYDEVKEKLKHNLKVMPKDNNINGVVYIWKIRKGKAETLKLSMDEKFSVWKNEYNKFIDDFNANVYIYYISTIDSLRYKHYRTIIVLMDKKDKLENLYKYLDYTDIEQYVKKPFIEKIEELRKTET